LQTLKIWDIFKWQNLKQTGRYKQKWVLIHITFYIKFGVAQFTYRKKEKKMGVLNGLEPACVFRYFEEIAGIPHGSTDTKKISDYCVKFAADRNLKCVQDEHNNVIIFKSASKGYEAKPPVMLQGHLDMVCEKEAGCDIDFKNEGLRLTVRDGIISAEGTTLGGDDGIAVAYMLAILDSDEIKHPALECVFTVDEEIGMLGAAALDCSILKSKTLINIDSEDEGILTVGCAGGLTATMHVEAWRTEADGKTFELKVYDLLGGHSGVEIDRGRANASMLLGRTLFSLKKKGVDFRLISVNGGLKDNAIPREAVAELVLCDESQVDVLKNCVEEIQNIYINEYRATDPDIKVSVEEMDCSGCNGSEDAENGSGAVCPMDEGSTNKVVAALMNLPNGVQRMNYDINSLSLLH